MKKFKLILSILLAYSASAYADDNYTTYYANDAIFMPLPSRLTVTATTGSHTYGDIDGMVPLVGTSTQMLYGDLEGRYGQHRTWFGNLGLGYRGVVSDHLILGGYLAGERENASGEAHFTVLNPGLEMTTDQFDAHINAYLPIGDRSQYTGHYYGDQIGKQGSVNFRGHTQYNELFHRYETVGRGLDTELGFTFPTLNRTRIFGGAYTFKFDQAKNADGFMGGVNVPIDQHFSLEARDVYDKTTHNAAFIGLKVNFGGISSNENGTVADRMLDPIERHVAAIDGKGTPTQHYYLDQGQVMVKNDIYFFSPNAKVGATQDGTYENPYNSTAFNQILVNTVYTKAQDASFYLAPATYTATGTDAKDPLTLPAGQSIWGRSADFKTTSDRSQIILNGALVLNGNNDVNDLSLLNNQINEVGLTANGDNAIIHDVQIGVSAQDTNANTQAYDTGLLNYGETYITNSTIYGGRNDNNLAAIGVTNASNSTLTIDSSKIYVTGIDSTGQTGAYGLQNSALGTVNLHDSVIDVSTQNQGNNNSGNSVGLLNDGITTIDDSHINSTSSNNIAQGIINENGGDLKLDQTSINAIAQNGSATGLYNSDQSNAEVINHSSIMASSNGTVYGVTGVSSAGQFVLDNSVIAVTNQGGTAYGLDNVGDAKVLNNSTITATVNPAAATVIGVYNIGTLEIQDSQLSAIVGTPDSSTIGVYGLYNFEKGIVQSANSTFSIIVPSITTNTKPIRNENGGVINFTPPNTCEINGVVQPNC